MSKNDNNVLVKYIRNADSGVSTGAIKLGDDREDIVIGGVGYVSADEINILATHGVILEPIDEQDARDQGLLVDAPAESLPLSADLTQDQIDEIAGAEGVDISGARSKAKAVELIQDARAKQDEGAASLPATASSGPAAPVAPATTAGSTSGSAS